MAEKLPVLTEEQSLMAVERLAVLNFFPSRLEPVVRVEIARQILRMFPSMAVLNKTIDAMSEVGQWYGLGELRGVLCCFGDPLNGERRVCLETPGYTADDLEARHARDAMEQGERLMIEERKRCPPTEEELESTRKWAAEWEAGQAAKKLASQKAFNERIAARQQKPAEPAIPVIVDVRRERERRAEAERKRNEDPTREGSD